MKKIGIYGGTFDPIHCGHLILARDASESIGLEKVIFIPAAVSPFKNSPHANADLRWAMLKAAIDDQPMFAADDCELRRAPPSYTIDTVERIRNREGDAEIFYLIGQDNVAELPKWHRFSELEKHVRFVVLDRTGSEKAQHGYPLVRRKIDISATEIRKRVALGRSIRYLVAPVVESMILREKIYREPLQ